jgi:tetratricopeptide (TPR) repeat protein
MVLCIAVAVSLFAQAVADPGTLLKLAIELHRSGDLEGAVREYRAFLAARPLVVQVRSNLGAALAGLGRYSEAIAEYEQALKKDPANAGILMNLGLAYYKMGQVPLAAEQFAAARAVVADNQQVTLLLADCWLRMGENENVVSLLEPLRESNDRAVAYLLGTALIRAKQPERGQVLIDRILRDGGSAEALMLLGSAKFEALDFAGALADFEKAAALNPNLPEIHGYHGRALQATGDPAGAVAAFRRELKQNPNDYHSNLYLGGLLREERNYEEARPLIEAALRVRPDDVAAQYQLALILLAGGDAEGARLRLERVVAKAPSFTQAHVSLATVYYRLKRKAEGDREREIVRKLNEDAQARQPGVKAP